MKITSALLVLAVSGCASMSPDYLVISPMQHVSHPSVGWPFGPRFEEDTVTQVAAGGIWEFGNLKIDQRLGYLIETDGFKGPRVTYYGSVDYIIPLKRVK